MRMIIFMLAILVSINMGMAASINMGMADIGNLNSMGHGAYNISGFIINDSNGNGIKDPDETGLSNWLIKLNGIGIKTTGIEKETFTDSNGFYQFTNLNPGRYMVTEEMESGFFSTDAFFKETAIIDHNIANLNFINTPNSINKRNFNNTPSSKPSTSLSNDEEGNFLPFGPGEFKLFFKIIVITFGIIFLFLISIIIYKIFIHVKQKFDSAPQEEIEGVVRILHNDNRSIGNGLTETILNFRVERTDETGNILDVVPVEMRGHTIHGYIADGDMVRVKGKMKDGTIIAKEALNISTGSKINTGFY